MPLPFWLNIESVCVFFHTHISFAFYVFFATFCCVAKACKKHWIKRIVTVLNCTLPQSFIVLFEFRCIRWAFKIEYSKWITTNIKNRKLIQQFIVDKEWWVRVEKLKGKSHVNNKVVKCTDNNTKSHTHTHTWPPKQQPSRMHFIKTIYHKELIFSTAALDLFFYAALSFACRKCMAKRKATRANCWYTTRVW